MAKKARKRRKKNEDSAHYVDNSTFTDAIIEYRNQVLEAEEKGEAAPPMSAYLGECILKIAKRLSFKSNFINYTYREEMVSDAVENCVNYLSNFNPEKSTNGFAYVTQICYFAFIRRIEKEKKQQRIKFKLIEKQGIPGLYDLFANKEELADDDPTKKILNEIQLSQFDIEKLEEAEQEEQAKKKGKKRGLEKLM